MKMLISHDVDHLTVWEHRRDLIVPKHLVRNALELLLRRITVGECGRRLKDVVRNKWHNIEALAAFDRMHGVRSTFFIGVARGLGLSYSREQACYWVEYLAKRGFEVGVHGICYDDQQGIAEEYGIFRAMLKNERIGIRNHYLRRAEKTLEYQDGAGYVYDASMYGVEQAFKVGSMWEIPLDIMDGRLFYGSRRWKTNGLEAVREMTRRAVEEAVDAGKDHFSILFHDRYFSESYVEWKEWYVWLIEWLGSCGFEFQSHGEYAAQLGGRTAPIMRDPADEHLAD